jgi:WD40 repeat protein
MFGPFEGNVTVINCVGFSPDGKQIVSGSWDSTIRIWDVVTGQALSDPLKGHTDGVASVSFLS